MEAIDKAGNKNRKTFKIILSLVAALLIAGGLAFAYAHLQQANARSEQRIDELNEKLATMSDRVQTLSKAGVSGVVADEGGLVIEGDLTGFHLDTEFKSSRGDDIFYGKDQRGYNTLYIDVAVVNEGSEGAFVGPGMFKLKDEFDKVYELRTEKLQNRSELQGKQLLQDQQLGMNEKTTGTIAFQVPPDLQRANLHLNSQVYPVKIY